MNLPKFYRGSLVGFRSGRIVVTADAGHDARGNRLVTIDCSCGTKGMIVLRKYVRNGDRVSCGCRHVECTTGGASSRTHGAKGTAEYRVWLHIKDRCRNPRNPAYAGYGGRGIAVCDRWLSFENFLADMGPRPPAPESANGGRYWSIERIDVNGNYEPGNCRWATYAEQMRNTRRTRAVSLNGRTQCLRDWANETRIPYDTLRDRLNQGWTEELALTTPVGAPWGTKFGANGFGSTGR